MKLYRILLLGILLCWGIESRSQCSALVSSLTIRTGYDHSTGTLVSVSSCTANTNDPNWFVISDPDISSIESRNANVNCVSNQICGSYNCSFSPLSGSLWINSYNTTLYQKLNSTPSKFEYKFCLKTVSSPTLTLNMKADDYAVVYLNNTSIGTTGTITNCSDGTSTSTITTSTSSLFLAGENTIRVELFDNSTYTVCTNYVVKSIGFCMVGSLTTSTSAIYTKSVALNEILVNGTTFDVTTQTVTSLCKDQAVNLSIKNSGCNVTVPSSAVFTWDFGDGTSATGQGVSHKYTATGTFSVSLSSTYTNVVCGTPFALTITDCSGTQCDKCISSFAPDPGEYILSAWVREDQSSPVKTYTNAGIGISFINDPTVYGPFNAQPDKNKIIDGWQRIEERFTVPPNATDLKINMVNTSSSITAFFDDIRIHPVNGNMKSYVYDPITLRLVAELDENNYATLYEYNEEGQLIRVKKETERGRMTIKETRSANKKQ